ncbi:MAG: 4-(cytidine 5'-diphospho)-2-C-methyl-D-erythritol kinase [Crocinitomicaceae bacterium]
MITYPSAKINIGLNVIEKRIDGYHNIESIFYPIPLVDILEINRAEQFSFSTSGLAIPGNSENNLVIKAFKLMQERHGISNVKIHLHKQIPMGAGLGGGSSDAAFALSSLNTLFKLQLSTHELEKYAIILGSDCPFFIENTPKYVTGTGQELKKIELNLNGYYLYLINPKIHIGTKEAYSGIEPKKSKEDLTVDIKQNPNKWKLSIKNDFETSVFPAHPNLNQIKRNLYSQGAIYSSMSGSGSTLYGIFKSKPTLVGEYDYEKIILL